MSATSSCREATDAWFRGDGVEDRQQGKDSPGWVVGRLEKKEATIAKSAGSHPPANSCSQRKNKRIIQVQPSSHMQSGAEVHPIVTDFPESIGNQAIKD
jgi:hypothetical protein